LIDLYIVGSHQQGKHPHTTEVNPARIGGAWSSAVSEGRVGREVDTLYRRYVEGRLLAQTDCDREVAKDDCRDEHSHDQPDAVVVVIFSKMSSHRGRRY
jgi:hypothetical protein